MKTLLLDIAEAMNWKTNDKEHELYTAFKDICDALILKDEEFRAEKGQFYYSKINEYIDSQRLGSAEDSAKAALAAFKKGNKGR